MELPRILKEVHSTPTFERYEETNVRNNTNCYSHALGTTQMIRVGQISGKKDTNEKYISFEEIIELLIADLESLNLQLEESSVEEKISENQYKIALFVKKWSNGEIADYHFWRCDNEIWTEKWKGRYMNEIEDFERDSKDTNLRTLIGIYKITR